MGIRNVKSVTLINRMTKCDYHYIHVYLELYNGTSAWVSPCKFDSQMVFICICKQTESLLSRTKLKCLFCDGSCNIFEKKFRELVLFWIFFSKPWSSLITGCVGLGLQKSLEECTSANRNWCLKSSRSVLQF